MAYVYNPAGAARFADDKTAPLLSASPSLGALDAGLNAIDFAGNVYASILSPGALKVDVDGFQSALINDDYCALATSTLTLTNNATNYIWVENTGSGGSAGTGHDAAVHVNTSGFPTYPGTRHVRLAVVVCASGAIVSYTDKRPRMNV